MVKSVTVQETKTVYEKVLVERWESTDGNVYDTEKKAIAHDKAVEAAKVLEKWINYIELSDGESYRIVNDQEELDILCQAWKAREEDPRYLEYSVDLESFFLEKYFFPYVAIVRRNKLNRYQYDDGWSKTLVFVSLGGEDPNYGNY